MAQQDELAAAVVAILDKIGPIEVAVGDLPDGAAAVLASDDVGTAVILGRDSSIIEWAEAVIELTQPMLV